MSDPASVSANTPRDFAERLVDALTGLGGELALESGPYTSGLVVVSSLAHNKFVELQAPLLELQERLPNSADVAWLKSAFERWLESVKLPLEKGACSSDKEQSKHVAEQCKKDCIALRDEVCRQFGIPPPSRKAELVRGPKAIVVTDLVKYRGRVGHLLGNATALGDKQLVHALETLDAIIRRQINHAVADLGSAYRAADHALSYTGDGAVLTFDRVSDAVRFTNALHLQAARASEEVPGLPYRHRVGLAFGWVMFAVTPRSPVQVERSGLPFVEATRMEACSPPGGVAIEDMAWKELLRELHRDREAGPCIDLSAGFVEQRFTLKDDELYQVWTRKPEAAGAGASP